MAPEHKLRVIAPDVGGGFGSKIFIYPEEVVCLWASKQRRPAGEMDVATAPKRSSPTRMAATTSPMPRWRSTTTARSSALQGQDHRQSRRLHVDLLVVGADLSLRARCCRASTTSRRSIARSTRSTPTPCRSTPIAAPGGRRRPSWSSGWSRSARASWASIRPSCAGRTSSRSFPHQTPVIMTYDAGDYHASLKKALEIADVKGFGKRKRDCARARQAARHRLFDLHRGLRHRAVAGGRLARRRRRLVGIRRGAGQPDRLGRGADRLPQPRPGPRDHLRAARLRAARHPDRQRQRSCTATPTRCSSAWAPTARAPARSACRRSSRRSTRSRPRPRRSRPIMLEAAEGDIEFKDGKFTVAGTDKSAAWGEVDAQRLYRAQVHRRAARARPEGGRVLRPDQLHLPGRLPHLRGRDRSGDRQHRDRRLDRGRRLRHRHQSDDRRGPGARRHRAGRRPGAARERGLRQGRPARDRLVHGLHHAARRQSAVVQGRHHR